MAGENRRGKDLAGKRPMRGKDLAGKWPVGKVPVNISSNDLVHCFHSIFLLFFYLNQPNYFRRESFVGTLFPFFSYIFFSIFLYFLTSVVYFLFIPLSSFPLHLPSSTSFLSVALYLHSFLFILQIHFPTRCILLHFLIISRPYFNCTFLQNGSCFSFFFHFLIYIFCFHHSTLSCSSSWISFKTIFGFLVIGILLSNSATFLSLMRNHNDLLIKRIFEWFYMHWVALGQFAVGQFAVGTVRRKKWKIKKI